MVDRTLAEPGLLPNSEQIKIQVSTFRDIGNSDSLELWQRVNGIHSTWVHLHASVALWKLGVQNLISSITGSEYQRNEK